MEGLGHKCKAARLFILECEDSNKEDKHGYLKELKEKAECSSKKNHKSMELEPSSSIHAL